MAAILSPPLVFQGTKVEDGVLKPLAGGKLYAYAAGTSTPLATYTDQTGSTPAANPIVLDANGQAVIWLGTSPYKLDLFEVLPGGSEVRMPNYPVDNVDPASYSSSALLNTIKYCHAGPFAPPNPQPGMLWFQTVPLPGRLFQYDNNSTWQSIPYQSSLGSGFRNLLINSNLGINQRGYVSGAATSAPNQYTIDRWRVVVSGENLAWTGASGVITYTAPAGGVEQVIESSMFQAGSYVLNWDGTATATVGGIAVSKGIPFSRLGGVGTTVRFTGGTFAKPQLEFGSVPTVYEVRHPQQETAMCERYYWKLRSTVPVIGYATGAGIGWYTFIKFPVSMRANPTVTPTYSGTTNCSATTTANISVDGVNANITSTAAGLFYSNLTALVADAEL